MTELEPHLLTVLMQRIFLPPDQRDAKAVEAAIEKLNKPFVVLDAELADRKYLVGDSYSVADVNVASVLSWVSLLSIDVTKFANLERWLDVCTSRPACKKARSLMGA
jgi:glutathione S-transferase